MSTFWGGRNAPPLVKQGMTGGKAAEIWLITLFSLRPTKTLIRQWVCSGTAYVILRTVSSVTGFMFIANQQQQQNNYSKIKATMISCDSSAISVDG